jgi:tetratricopeptide (TPR) repeat protein
VENVSNRGNECHKTLLVARHLAPIFVSTQYGHGARAFGGRVSDSENKLRHLPFFEEIASLAEEDPAARSATAGLLVLRLFDSWIEDGVFVVSEQDFGARNIVSAIEEMDAGSPIRSILLRIVSALQAKNADIHGVLTPLMAYAQSLEYEAKWHLAGDVYQTVLAHLHPVEDSDASVAAHLRLGQCHRHLSQIQPASESFQSAAAIAAQSGDLVGVLRARIGEAHVAILRGNIPSAEHILDDTIRQASGPELQDVRSRALHDRATVAHMRHQYEYAIQLAYDALAISQSSAERDRILGDIAVSFLELGVYSAAQDAYLVLSATAQEQYIRWGATLNLLEISFRTGAETHFHLYRRHLASYALPPLMATAFELATGSGYRRFDEQNKARHHLQRALRMATEHGFNQYLFAAEEALLQLETPAPVLQQSVELSLNTEEVAQAIRELRVAAGV